MSTVLSICTDLIFSTKIFSTAQSLNVPIVAARSLEAIAKRLDETPIALVVVDLNTTVLDPIAAIRAIKSHAMPEGRAVPRIVAFLSHVQVELAEAARDAGADHVLARSGFTMQLPAILGSVGGGSR